METLNLGCGRYPKPGCVNVDIDPASGADVFHDLSSFPYPFEEESFDNIEADHLLEHLPDPVGAVREMHRLLKPGGQLLLRVPHFSRGMTHWDHKRGFDVSFPLYFSPQFKGGYTGIELSCDSMKLVWFAQPWLKKETLSAAQYAAGSILGRIFDFLGNLSPYATSRLFCFWVGGYEEVEFRFSKPR